MLFLGFSLGTGWLTALWAVLLLCLALILKSPRLRVRKGSYLVLLTAAAALMTTGVYTDRYLVPAEKMQGQRLNVSATLCELPYEQYGHWYYTLQTDGLRSYDGTELKNIRMRVSSSEELKAEPFDNITLTVLTDEERSLHDIAKGTLLCCTIDEEQPVRITPARSRPPYYYALLLRRNWQENIKKVFPANQAAFISALLTGDKTQVSSDVKSDMSSAGLSHILVVSGFHLSVLTQMLLMGLYRLFRRKRRIAPVVCGVLLMVYMAAVGFPPSVMRAGIMQLVMLGGLALSRRSDAVNSLGFSVLLITLLRPVAAVDISLLLSFCSTLGILVLTPRTERFLTERLRHRTESSHRFLRSTWERLARGIVKAFSVSLAAALFSLPIVLLCFGRLSLYGIPANVLITPVVAVMLPLAFVALLFHYSVILSFAAIPLGAAAGLLTEFVTQVAAVTARLPFSTINASQEFVPWWIVAMLLLAGVLAFGKRVRYRAGIFALAAVLSFVTGLVLSDLSRRDMTEIAVLNTGDGLSVMLQYDNKAAVLSCGGSAGRFYVISDYLDSRQVQQLSYCLVSDGSNRSSRYVRTLMEHYSVGLTEVYRKDRLYDSLREAVEGCENRVEHSKADKTVNRVILGSKKLASTAGYQRIAVFADIHGFRVLIVHDRTDIRLLPEEWKHCDLLIVNGRIKNAEQIECGMAIISDTAANSQLYSQIRADRVYLTGQDGSLIVRLNRQNQYSVRRERQWLR